MLWIYNIPDAAKKRHSFVPRPPRDQTGRPPESNRVSPGIKPGEPRDQTGRPPESNRVSPGIKPGEPRNEARVLESKKWPLSEGD